MDTWRDKSSFEFTRAVSLYKQNKQGKRKAFNPIFCYLLLLIRIACHQGAKQLYSVNACVISGIYPVHVVSIN